MCNVGALSDGSLAASEEIVESGSVELRPR